MKFQFLQNSLRTYILGAVVLAAAALLVYFWYQGGTPAAVVNGSPVTVRRMMLNYNAAASYYANAQKAYPAEGQKELDKNELQAEVLTRLIEAELIESGLRSEVGGEADYLLGTKLARYENNRQLEDAATAAYNMNYQDFWNEVIVPQAKRDILSGRLFLRGESMDEWLTRAKRDANVILFTDGFRWNGAYVEIVK